MCIHIYIYIYTYTVLNTIPACAVPGHISYMYAVMHGALHDKVPTRSNIYIYIYIYIILTKHSDNFAILSNTWRNGSRSVCSLFQSVKNHSISSPRLTQRYYMLILSSTRYCALRTKRHCSIPDTTTYILLYTALYQGMLTKHPVSPKFTPHHAVKTSVEYTIL